MRVFIASDHAGLWLKEDIKKFLKRKQIPFEDLGTDSLRSVDYPDFAVKVAEKVAKNKKNRGILICGTGTGMTIAACVERCFDKIQGKAKALEIGVAGQVDSSGTVRTSPNLGWKDFPLKANLEEKLNLPVFVTNDVRAALWGEWRFGAGKGVMDLVVVFVGTGIGGVIEALPEIIPSLEIFIKKRALSSAAEKVKIVKSALGNKAGIVGAAALTGELLGERT